MKTFKIFILLAMILPCLCACDSPVSNNSSDLSGSQPTSGTGGNSGNSGNTENSSSEDTFYAYDKLCNRIINIVETNGCEILEIPEEDYSRYLIYFVKSAYTQGYAEWTLWAGSKNVTSEMIKNAMENSQSIYQTAEPILAATKGNNEQNIDPGIYAIDWSQKKIWKLTSNSNYITEPNVPKEQDRFISVINGKTFLFRYSDNLYSRITTLLK